MPLPGSASCGTASNSNDIEGLNELIDLLNDHGEALLGFEEPGPEHTANRTEEPADTPAHVCTLPSASEAIATANYRVSAPATQRAATTAAAKHRKNVKLSSSRKQKLELEYLLAEHQSIQQQLQSLQLDNKRLRLKQALLHAINQAKQQLLDVLWQHREATSSDGNSSKSNDNTIAALQDLEQQVQQLLQASGAIELPTEPGSSSTSNGTDGSTHSSWHSGSPSSSGAFLARAASYTAAAAAQQQQSLPPRLPLQHTISLPNNPQQPNLQQQQQQKSPQQQQLGDAAGAAAEGWCPDPLQDPLWLLKRGMAHLNLSAAVVASREERLVAWQHVQGQLSLLLRAIDNDEGEGLPAAAVGGRSAAAARQQLMALISSWAGHVISAHIVSPYEHMSWSVTNMEDMTQRHAPPELYRCIIQRLQLTDAQQQTIAQGLAVFHQLLLSLKAQQTRLQQQLQQLLQQTQQRPAGAAAAAVENLQEQQQLLEALLARQDDLTWLQPEKPAATPSTAAAAAASTSQSAASNAAALLPLLDLGQSSFDQQHQLLQRVETNNWQLSWVICLLNFFISGVLDLRQLCKCAVYSYPWPWWPGPFAEEVLKMYQDKQQQNA